MKTRESDDKRMDRSARSAQDKSSRESHGREWESMNDSAMRSSRRGSASRAYERSAPYSDRHRGRRDDSRRSSRSGRSWHDRQTGAHGSGDAEMDDGKDVMEVEDRWVGGEEEKEEEEKEREKEKEEEERRAGKRLSSKHEEGQATKSLKSGEPEAEACSLQGGASLEKKWVHDRYIEMEDEERDGRGGKESQDRSGAVPRDKRLASGSSSGGPGRDRGFEESRSGRWLDDRWPGGGKREGGRPGGRVWRWGRGAGGRERWGSRERDREHERERGAGGGGGYRGRAGPMLGTRSVRGEKWAHDKFEEVCRSPSPPPKDEALAKIEALLAL